MPGDSGLLQQALAEARVIGGRALIDALKSIDRAEEDRGRRLAYKLELLSAMERVPCSIEERCDELFSLHILAIVLGEYELVLPFAREYAGLGSDRDRPVVESTRLFFCAIVLGAAGAFDESVSALDGVLARPEVPSQFPYWYVRQLAEACARGDCTPFRRWAREGIPAQE